MKPHTNQNIEKRFIISLSLTIIILLAEVIGGLWTGSLALLSDAAHVFMDIFALGLSYLALRLSSLPPDDRHTYGYHRLEVLAALTNGLTLIGIAIGIFYEAYERWLTPQPVKSLEMLVIASIGLVVNLVVAFVLRGGPHAHHEHSTPHQEDINVKSAFLHVIGDAISSIGVILAAGIIWLTGYHWIDPLMSVLIGVIILISSWRVLKSSLHILTEGTPEGLSIQDVARTMADVPGICEIHDLHVWNICSGHVALSSHAVLIEPFPSDTQPIMDEIKTRLLNRFGIEHTTIQFERTGCGQGKICQPCQ
jgi:cobalt-zinc-cadmium efflux system protein